MDIEKVVKEASAHFAIWKTGTQLGKLRRFQGLLKLAADTTDPSQPERRATFEYAKKLVGEIIKGLEKKSA